MITVTITDKLQIAGANFAWIAANNSDQADAQAYLQAMLENACVSYAQQGAVDRVSSGEFVLRFTSSEFSAINSAALTDPQIAGFLAATRATPTVRVDAKQTTDALAYLVSKKLLTQERSDEIGFYPIPVKPDPTSE